MKQILFHSYHFPPIGGSGAQRPLRLARYLVDHGYRPTVVTGGGATDDRWAPEDATLTADVPAELAVLRLPSSGEPQTLSSRWRGRAERLLRVPSPWARWWIEGSVDLARAAAAEADLVYCWMQPYESATAARRIAHESGKPWVADLGDPWALDEMRVYPSTLHRWLDSRQMHAELATAAAIVMSTPEAAARLLQRFPSLADRPVVAIPNGFDAGTFAGSPVPRTDEAFRIVHTGYLHTELGLELRRSLPSRRFRGGSVRGLDILTRSHVMLVEALNLLLERRPDLHDVLELHLAGVLTDTDAAVAARTPVARLQGYVSHRESIDLVRSADLLFLPMQNLPLGTRATIVPGKTYEYLASGRPILAAVPDGDARDILAEAGTGILCRPDDVAAMAQAIESQVDRRLRSEPPPAPRPEVIARYEYRALARRLADVFDQVLA